MALNPNPDAETLAFLLSMQRFVLDGMQRKIISTTFGLKMLDFITQLAAEHIGSQMVVTEPTNGQS